MSRRFLLVLVPLMLAICASSASATTSYLRPNSNPSVGSWSTTGAPAAWDALNDEVTELGAPSGSDYITTTTASTKAKVGLTSTSLAGNTILSATAWIYTSNANPVSFKAGNSESWTSASSVGWHSAPVTLSGTQDQLDNLALEFNSGSGTASRVIQAAFLKLNLELSAPKIYWGAWIDGDAKLLNEPPEEPAGDAPWDSGTWEEFETDTGKPVSLVHFGQPPPWNQEFRQCRWKTRSRAGRFR